jgi:hypothetical protein
MFLATILARYLEMPRHLRRRTLGAPEELSGEADPASLSACTPELVELQPITPAQAESVSHPPGRSRRVNVTFAMDDECLPRAKAARRCARPLKAKPASAGSVAEVKSH